MMQKFHNDNLVHAVSFEFSQTRVIVVAAFEEQAVADGGSYIGELVYDD